VKNSPFLKGVFVVQIKQKFNKINITALITCFILIMVFVFGCVQFAFANDSSDIEKAVASSPGQFYLVALSDHVNGSKDVLSAVSMKFDADNMPNRICGVLKADGTMNSGYKILSDVKFNSFYCYYNSWSLYGGTPNDNDLGYYSAGGLTAIRNIKEYKTNVLLFGNDDDAKTYILTGQVNNAIYKPKENVEYDSDIEVPINLDIQLNGSSDFVPNVRISCNQSEIIDNRQLEVSYSVGYRATWKLLGGIGLNIKSKTSSVVYGSIEQLDDSFDNSGTAFETIISLSKFSDSSPPDKNAFSQYEPTPKVYWSLKEIKNENSEIKIWVRNRVGNKASKWVMVSGDSYKANFDVVSSDENGNPTDLKDNSANADTGYGSNYWNNRDTTPQGDYSSTNVKTDLKDLKSNYTSLANFYKELFSFLPAEIWIILIGLVSTMVVIAIIKFVRG
jgi:hypothetical protein